LPYTPQTWSDNNATYPLSAARMSVIELGVQQAQSTAEAAAIGTVPLDSFSGATDSQKFANALAYQAAQTYKAPIRFPARTVTLQGPFLVPDGMCLVGPQIEREYSATSTFWNNEPSCLVQATSTGSYFFGMNGSAGTVTYNGSWLIQGIQFRTSQASLDWLQPYTSYPGPVLALATFRDFGLVGFRKPIHALLQACDFSNFHIQNSGDVALNLSGSDSNIGALGSHQYIDNCGVNLPSVQLRLDASVVSGLYVTPTAAGCAVRVDGGGGTRFIGNNFDSAAQNGAAAMCKGALVQLRGGVTVWSATRLFGCMYDAATADGGTAQNKGYFTATGGKHVIVGAHFMNGTDRASSDYTPAGTPHVYATSAVGNVSVAGLWASDALVLKHATAGKIVTDMSAYLTVG
jgi:hypothetical protein